MISRIALALTIAAISTSAAAQSSRKTTWDDLLKPYEAKTRPGVPVAPLVPPEILTAVGKACEAKALGELPKIQGMRVTRYFYKFLGADHQEIMGTVFVSAEVSDERADWNWACTISKDGRILLIAMY